MPPNLQEDSGSAQPLEAQGALAVPGFPVARETEVRLWSLASVLRAFVAVGVVAGPTQEPAVLDAWIAHLDLASVPALHRFQCHFSGFAPECQVERAVFPARNETQNAFSVTDNLSWNF